MKTLFKFNIFILLAMVIVTLVAISSTAKAQTAAADIQRAESYLKNLSTIKANFVQRAYNGTELNGTFYLNRPGKLRFEYDGLDDFVVADGIFIYFYDSELGEQSNAPIGQTLANFLLREDLSLTKDLTVNQITRNEGLMSMALTEKGDEGAGSVKLFFTEEPYALQKWQVTDAAGLVTEIELSNIERDLDLPAGLFKYFKPKQDKPQYN